MISKRTAIYFLVCVYASLGNAEEWSRFRGPNGDGTGRSSLPISWTPEANVAWRAPLPGPGVSSPIVVGDRVFITCYSGYGLERDNPGDIKNLRRHLVCYHATTGDKLWQKDIAATQPEDPYTGIGVTAHGYASHSPVSDGQHVYVYFGKSGAFAFDLDGNQLWQKDIGTESDPWSWGSASSPIVYENFLIVTASAESQAIVALDTSTGQEVWRQEAAGLDGMWGTPVLVQIDDRRTDLVMNVPKEMWGLDPSNGRLLWYCASTGAEQAHSSPVVVGDTVFGFTGRGGGSYAIRAGGKGDVTDSNIVWTGRDSARFASPVAHDQSLYLVGSGVLSQIDAKSGKRVQQIRLRGGDSSRGRGRFGSSDYASPVIADGKLYYVNGKGETFVFELGDEPQQLSINLVTTDAETFGGTPAISDGRLFLRSDKHLYCVAKLTEDVEPNASAKFIVNADTDDADEADNDDRPERGRFRRGPGGGGPGGRGFSPTAIFERRDANNDGKLTEDEIEGTPMASRLADWDTDGDDALSLEEFENGTRRFFQRGGRGAGRGGGGFGRRGAREDSRPERPQRPQS